MTYAKIAAAALLLAASLVFTSPDATRLLAAPVYKTDTLSYGKFGKITIYRTSDEPSSVVLFVSGDGGWNQGVVSMAKHLAAQDAMVVGIDIRTYLKAIEGGGPACAYPAADFEQLSQYVQKTLGYRKFHRPILAGYSSGATLVYALLGQAPRGTFDGAISLGFCPDLQIKRSWCKGFGLEYTQRADHKGVDFSLMPSITEPWYVLQGLKDEVCNPTDTQAFAFKIPTAHFVPLPKVGHGYSVESNWLAEFMQSFQAIVASAHHPGAVSPIGEKNMQVDPAIKDLPLVEVPTPSPAHGDTMALIITGDGGWAGLDRAVATRLSEQGVPVIGFDALSYFWNRRTPDETAKDVESAIQHYRAAWHVKKVLLIGYSFGADVMPFVVHRLNPSILPDVSLMSLIVPSKQATFEFHVAEWAGIDLDHDFPTLPEMETLHDVKTLCIFGSEEHDSLCPALHGPNVKALSLPGGHHVGGDYDRLVSEILSAAR